MNLIHAIVHIQNWGEDSEPLSLLKHNPHVISIFHIMGRKSYLLDVNFDDKGQLENWIAAVKSIRLSSGVPAVLAIETMKVIESHKKKEAFTLSSYKQISGQSHFFVKIDNPHHDQDLISVLSTSNIVQSLLHVQGDCSYICEIITADYADYKNLLQKIKSLPTVFHLETQEVLSVIKYRSQVIDESGNLSFPGSDFREMYSL